jgi:hypothetical protein
MLTALLLCATGIAGFLLYRRLQRGAHLIGGMIEAPAPVRAAAKRVGFRAQPNVHSIVGINSPELCVATMALAFAQMDGNTEPCSKTLKRSLQKHLQVEAPDITDFCTLAPWLVEQGGGATPAFERLTKRLKQLDHGPYFGKMMSVLGDVAAAGTKGMPSAPQADAMGALARIFRTA